MQTRTGLFYTPNDHQTSKKTRKRQEKTDPRHGFLKKRRTTTRPNLEQEEEDLLELLPDDLVLSILSHLSSTASSASDLMNVILTCRRLKGLGLDPVVLGKASEKALEVSAGRWSEGAHGFLKKCAEAGNMEACYTLGMITFYCLGSRATGAALLAKAALSSHPAALYSLSIIQFNGSGATKSHKDLRAGFALCSHAASLHHPDALRELGHCLHDGYGVPPNPVLARLHLLHANTLQPTEPSGPNSVANKFMVEWFGMGGGEQGVRLCSNAGCGRPETRRHEFRRCSVCGKVNYCSRACQASDWKVRHKEECLPPVGRWIDGQDGIVGEG